MATQTQLDALLKNAKLGGFRRAQSLSPSKRKQIAKKAAKARWDKAKLDSTASI